MDTTRAITCGALVAAITAGIQYMTGGLNLTVAAIDGGLMAGSVIAADAVSLSNFIPPIVPPSIVAGGVYAVGQKFIRGDNNYAVNVGVGAAADYLVDSMSS